MRITRSHCQKLKAATANQNKRQSLNRKDAIAKTNKALSPKRNAAIAKSKSDNRQIEKRQPPKRKKAQSLINKGTYKNSYGQSSTRLSRSA
jgi:hypothetical protein